MSVSLQQLQQQLNSIPNLTGSGVPVQTYATDEQTLLTQQLTSQPNAELTTLSNQSNALGSLQTALQQLQTATQSLSSAQTWTPVNATSSNTSSFTVTAGASALVSSLGVTVSNLAQNQVSVAQNTVTDTLSGTFGIYQGSGTSGTLLASITVTAGESLSNIISDVNANTASTGVEAFILSNNTLAFSSTKTGASSQFSLGDESGNFIASLGVSVTQMASDAQVSVGGTTVTSSTNTFSNLIPNVTLTVVAPGSGTLSVTQNTSSVVSTVQNWMSAYNNVIDLLHKDTAYTPATASAAASSGTLSGDANTNGLLAQLPSALNSRISTANGQLTSMASVGIVVDPNTGHLVFQSSSGFTINGKNYGGSLQDGQTMFENALQSNLTGVQNIFGVVQGTTLSTVIPTSGTLGALNNTLNEYLGFGLTQGAIPTELNSIKAQTNSINTYLVQVNQEISNRVSTYTSQLNALNASLQKSQSELQLVSSLFGTTSSSSSSSTTSNNSSSTSSPSSTG